MSAAAEPPPLARPDYVPEHPPIDGRVPAVVERWGPASQVRWFARFLAALQPLPASEWQRWHIHSEQHRGPCCISCEQDGEHFDSACCCRAL